MFMQASARLWRTNLVDWRAGFSTTMGPGMVYLESLRNHEREGVPSGAGTDTSKGFDLTKMHRLLAQLGDPQDAWQAVHISGTKGKGSTATMLASIASAAGLKTGCYTSPHVVSLHERILMDGKPITSKDLDQALVTVQPTAQGLSHASPELPPPSHFEVLTAAAFAHFAAAGTDLAVVEVGLGGARDATNAFRPAGLALSVVTPIGSDHLDALGGSVRSVAAAKAGVLKAGRPLVLAPQPLHEAHQEIKREGVYLCFVRTGGLEGLQWDGSEAPCRRGVKRGNSLCRVLCVVDCGPFFGGLCGWTPEILSKSKPGRKGWYRGSHRPPG
uniref:Mur ligase central domain-containing protein n=1 Tax=Auxenochlorella protothecoides TaxID=3075 RepID=A0A1D1ZUM4_AUXPR